MEKITNNVNEEQLDLFAIESAEDTIQNLETETLGQFDDVESVPTSDEYPSDNGTREISLELEEDTIQNLETETLSQFDDVENVLTSDEELSDNGATEIMYLRPFSSVSIGDKVKVQQHPVDNNPESVGYFDYHKGKKGVVLQVKENSNPINANYQFCATIQFQNGEEGIFYDLELEVIE